MTVHVIFLSNLSKNPEKISVSWEAIHNIKMISEGLCDAGDWSNYAENSALHHRNKL